MKPPQNDCLKRFRLQNDLYQNNIYLWKALMFQRITAFQPHLQNEMEKCLPASFHSCKDEPSLPGVLQRRPSSSSACSRYWLLTQAAKEKMILWKANVCSPLTLLSGTLWSAIRDTSWMQCFRTQKSPDRLFASPSFTPRFAAVFTRAFSSANLCELRLAWLLPCSVFCCWHYWPFWVVTNNWTISITIYWVL